jgi:hypothetical protein
MPFMEYILIDHHVNYVKVAKFDQTLTKNAYYRYFLTFYFFPVEFLICRGRLLIVSY